MNEVQTFTGIPDNALHRTPLSLRAKAADELER